MTLTRIIMLATVLALLGPFQGFAAQTIATKAVAQDRVETGHATTEFLAETDGIVAGETFWLAIRQEVEDGWHVFWVNPGDAGLPLNLNWSLPDGFETGDVLHPVPEFIPVGPLASYAHEGTPVFLVPIKAPDDLDVGDNIRIGVDASWQACEDICVPEEGQFEFTLPVVEEQKPRGENTSIFANARNALPAPFTGAATFTQNRGAYRLTISPVTDLDRRSVFFFPEPEGLIHAAGKQRAKRSSDGLVVDIEPGWVKSFEGDALKGVLTFADKEGVHRGLAIEAAVPEPIQKPTTPAGPAVAQSSIAILLAMAFVGGALLNLMPCVFPILFVKAASLMQAAGEDRSVVRRHGLLYGAGVLATFLLIGGLLLVLRAGGEQLGWGFHLQSPAVVTLSAYVLFLVGLNLAGVFSVGESIAGSGQSLASSGGDLGAFFTGALTVVVAAPCIGPLLSAPLGAALLQPPAVGMAIFSVLALGLAAPYLALSFSPALGRLLPRPGAWMKTFKQALAFPVFAAAAYFLWVLSQQADGSSLGFVLAGAVFLAVAAWLFELSKGDGTRALILRIASALFIVIALAPLTRLEARETTNTDQNLYGLIPSEPYSAAALENYRAEGQAVFVDFTAAWCVTCQFNKARVFSSRDVARAFERADVKFMVADWTVQDPEISAALASYGASGVPLYVFYPEEEDATIFPLPLSKKAVKEALSR